MKNDPLSLNSLDNIARQIAALSPRKRALLAQKLKSEAVNGHTLVARSLKRLGVTHVYCLSGTPIGITLGACDAIGIRPVGVRNQQAGVMMATAQNYVKGRLTAVSIVSPGPGATNAATGILVARDNCWPLVVLGGRRPLNMQGMGSFQEFAGVPVFESITKWSAVIETTVSIPEYIDRAYHTAISGRPGPVYLEMPEDVLNGSGIISESIRAEDHEPPLVDHRAINQAVDILLRAKRPALIMGNGIRWSEPYEEIQQLVNRFGIPFITSPMGQGYLPDDHHLCCNAVRGLLQSQADAILLLGARLDWTFRFGTELAPNGKLIRIDICSEELAVNVTPTVSLTGDAKQVLQQMLKRMETEEGRYAKKRSLDRWHNLLSEKRKERTQNLEAQMNSDDLPMAPHRMVKEIRDFLPRDAVCVLDGNVIMAVAQQILPSYFPASRLTPGSNGCMGVGVPFGIGAKLGLPDRLVVVVCGDTAIGLSAMDMETAVRHDVQVIVVVANNDGISGALTQKDLFPPNHERVTMFQPAIRYEQIMEAFGGHAEFVENPEEMIPALERAVASGRAACINVLVDPDAAYPDD